MIRFDCPGCGKSIKVGDAAAGKKGKCPDCGATVHVPQPAPLSDDDVLEMLGGGPATKRPEEKKWFYRVMGEDHGPVSKGKLTALAQAGTITPDSFVKEGEDGEWILSDHLPELLESPTVAGQPGSGPKTAANHRKSSPLAVAFLGLIVVAGFCVWCSGIFSSTDGDRVYVSKEQFGDEWPLTVPDGYVECIDGHFAVFHHDGKTWALNGLATSRGYPEIDPIWRDNPDLPGFKVNITPLLDLALEQGEDP